MNKENNVKTNQLMNIALNDTFSLEVFHLTGMSKLNTLWDYGNKLRVEKGLEERPLADWMRSKDVNEFIVELHNRRISNYGDSPHLELVANGHGTYSLSSPTPLVVAKRGKYGGTYVDALLLLKAASWLDKGLEIDILETFINSNILSNRDKAGESFKQLMKFMEGATQHQYILLSNAIRDKLCWKGDWNEANNDTQELRHKVHTQLINFIEVGFVSTFEELLAAIIKIKL